MSWAEFISQMLQATNKVDKAAVFNIKGQPLATTQDLQVSDKDGRALLLAVQDQGHNITRIHIDEMDFCCYQGNEQALVGLATNKSKRVLVARQTEEALIVVMGNPSGHGSFLHELQHNLALRTSRQKAPQPLVSEGGEARQDKCPQQTQTSMISPPQSPSRGVPQDKILLQIQD